MDSEVIKALKENLATLKGMDGGLRRAMESIGKKEFIFLLSNGTWDKANAKQGFEYEIYRLRSDYTEEPEVKGYMTGGVREKHIITKANGNKVDPMADYFVLRLDKDPHAVNAIKAYSDSVRCDNERLADDLRAKYDVYAPQAEEPEVVKCEVYPEGCGIDSKDFLWFKALDDREVILTDAPSYKNFIGFLYEAAGVKSEIFPTTRAYLGSDGVIRLYPQGKAEHEVLTPTHVLFKRKVK